MFKVNNSCIEIKNLSFFCSLDKSFYKIEIAFPGSTFISSKEMIGEARFLYLVGYADHRTDEF